MPTIPLIDPVGTDTHVERDRLIAQAAVGRDTEVVVRHVPALHLSAHPPASSAAAR